MYILSLNLPFENADSMRSPIHKF